MLAKLGSGGSQVQKPGMCHEFIRNCFLKKLVGKTVKNVQITDILPKELNVPCVMELV